MKTLLLSVVLALVGCGGNKGDDGGQISSDQATVKETPTPVDGTWVGECSGSDANYHRDVLKFSGSKAFSSSTSYSDKDCTTTYFIEKMERTLTMTGDDSFELTVVSTVGAVTDSRAIASYNNSNIYGYSDWATNKEKDLTGRYFNATQTLPVAEKGEVTDVSFKIKEDKIYFGKDGVINEKGFFTKAK